MKFVNDLNLKKQAEELGISVWQTPGFLFLMIGIVAIIVMTATFFISKNYNSPEVLVTSECSVAILILVLGNFVVRMVEQVARLNKMKNEFISVASHQLRTPVSAIQWETELLLSKLNKGLNNKQLKNIESIRLLSNRMARLVSDLLDVARIDQGRLVLRNSLVDVPKLIEEVIAEQQPLVRARNIKLDYCLGKRIPEIFVDREKIKMVIENLVTNAVKYTVNRGKIEVKVSKRRGNLLFSVKDNGVGIPKEQQRRVFERFFRSDNIVKHQTEGTGLGLYIAKNIVEQSGGKIWFQSIEGLGSVFSFSLPIKSQDIKHRM